MKYAIAAALILGAAFFITGCGKDDIGAAPVVKVSAEQRAQDINAEAEQTVTWLEGLPATDRQAALGRAPQIVSTLKEATDPALKSRIAALGLKL